MKKVWLNEKTWTIYYYIMMQLSNEIKIDLFCFLFLFFYYWNHLFIFYYCNYAVENKKYVYFLIIYLYL